MRAPTKCGRSIGPEDVDAPGRRFMVSEARAVAVGGSSGLDDCRWCTACLTLSPIVSCEQPSIRWCLPGHSGPFWLSAGATRNCWLRVVVMTDFEIRVAG